MTYVRLLKPVLANACSSSRAVVPTDTLSEGLRDRVNTATAE